MSWTETEPARRGAGLGIVVGSTAIAGLIGYVIIVVLARGLGDAYGLFAIFWSALYLMVGALAGVQQEITRATEERVEAPSGRRSANVIMFASAAALAAALIVMATSPLWATEVFGEFGVSLMVPLAVGAGLYVLSTAAAGTMYGTHSWRLLAAYIVLDVLFRLVLVVIGLAVGVGVVGLAWATVVPFALVVLVVVVPGRHALFSTSQLDVGYGAAVANLLRTVVAAASTAVLVSGFPLLVGLTTHDERAITLSAVVFALTLTRAPIVVVTLSLQSYLLVQFRDHPTHAARLLGLLLLGIAAVGATLALLAWWIGADVFVLLAGESFRMPAGYIGLLVASSVSTGWIMLTGTAVLARGGHTAYSMGWLFAAVVAIALMNAPGDVFPRTLLALSIAPLAGLVVHFVWLLRHRQSLELADA